MVTNYAVKTVLRSRRKRGYPVTKIINDENSYNCTEGINNGIL